MKDDEIKYDDLISKINSLQVTLSKLKNKLNSVYNMCDTFMCEDLTDDESKDIKNERRR